MVSTSNHVFRARERTMHLHGVTVRDILAEVRRTGRCIPYSIAGRIAADVATALHQCRHELTPSHVMVTFAGEVALVDARSPIPVRYLSPEQCLERPRDRRSDVFALGVLLYEMTTLHAPFGATLGDDDGIRQRIVAGAYATPDRLVPDYPRGLARIIDGCLEPVHALRYRTTEEVGAELVALTDHLTWIASTPDLARYLFALFGQSGPRLIDDTSPRRALARGTAAPPLQQHDDTVVVTPLRGKRKFLAGAARSTWWRVILVALVAITLGLAAMWV